MNDKIQDILGEICSRCSFPLLEKDQEKLICEKCELCPLEAMLNRLAAGAYLQGQIFAAQEILRGADPERLRR